MKRSMLVGLVLLGLAVHAQHPDSPPPKPAWRWTLEERLAVRQNPIAAAERLREAQLSGGSDHSRISPTSMPPDQADFISGRTHPELILPWELFDQLMGTAYAPDLDVRSIGRRALQSAVVESGLPNDFWDAVERLSVGYLSDVRQLRDLHKRPVTDPAIQKRIEEETLALEQLKCRDRAAAMAAARRIFGERFDRFLYQGIAPSMFVSVGRLRVSSTERELEIERGCQ